MKVTWIGHSCFRIEKNGYSIVIDPYTTGSVPGLRPIDVSADQVLCTHGHGDHCGREEVKLSGRLENESPFTVETIQTYHDEAQGAKRGLNQIFIITDGKERIAHFGDLGCDLTTEQKEKLKNLDVAFVPVGGYFTIDGKQAADLMQELNPRIVIPMHYRDERAGFGYDVIGPVEVFTENMPSVKKSSASEIDTDAELGAQVIVLQPLRGMVQKS